MLSLFHLFIYFIHKSTSTLSITHTLTCSCSVCWFVSPCLLFPHSVTITYLTSFKLKLKEKQLDLVFTLFCYWDDYQRFTLFHSGTNSWLIRKTVILSVNVIKISNQCGGVEEEVKHGETLSSDLCSGRVSKCVAQKHADLFLKLHGVFTVSWRCNDVFSVS